MKKLITLFVLFLGLGLANAQETKPTFDETVNYINNIFKENEVAYFPSKATGFISEYLVSELKIEQNGRVSFINKMSGKVKGTFNLFDFEKFEENGFGLLFLKDKNDKIIGNFSSAFPKSYIPKLEKAFKHLRTLCVKEHDPFE